MLNRKRYYTARITGMVVAAIICASALTACQTSQDITESSAAQTGSSSTIASQTNVIKTAEIATAVKFTSEDQETSWDMSAAAAISLNGDSITSDAAGVSITDSTATINVAGTYIISGSLAAGQIIIQAGDDDVVRLVLDDMDLTCLASAPINVVSAKKVILFLADGTENKLTYGAAGSTAATAADTDQPDAAVYSMADLTINGSGTLTVDANAGHGLVSKDKLKILGGTIVVNAAADGIKGRDYVAVKSGDITIDAASDGIQSNNDEDAAKGFIYIEGGNLNITAGNDGIQAETSILIKGGAISIAAGGEIASAAAASPQGGWGRDNNGQDSSSTSSAKGIKAAGDIAITGGTINIKSADDAINSNANLTVETAALTIASGDDGLHANTSIVINSGNLTISQSYEGIESAAITVNGGLINISSSDDGFNVAGGNDGSSVNGRPGQNEFTASGDYQLVISGGTIYINADGDGLDSNGTILMSGGTALVNGPTNDGNGAIDYGSSFQMTGGTLLAVGSSGMAEAPGDTSTQPVILANLTSTQTAGTLVHIESADGQYTLTFQPEKSFSSIVLCTPELEQGTTYKIMTGGDASGNEVNGLYEDSSVYSGGQEAASLTLSGIVTTYGSAGTPGGQGGQGGRKP